MFYNYTHTKHNIYVNKEIYLEWIIFTSKTVPCQAESSD